MGGVAAVIDETHHKAHLGPYTYITEDSQRVLSYKTVVSRHKSNLRGRKNDANIIHFGLSANPFWMIFSVDNKSTDTSFILDFGSPFEGRFALAERIVVRNDTLGKTFASTAGKNDQDNGARDLAKSAVPVKLKPESVNLFVIFMDPSAATPKTLSPTLSTQSQYLESSLGISLPKAGGHTFFILLIGFFAAIVFIKKQKQFTPFIAYYTLAALTPLFIEQCFYLELSWLSAFYPSLITITGLASLFLTYSFFNLRRTDINETRFISTIAGIAILCLVLNIVLGADMAIAKTALSILPFALILITCIFLSFAQGQTEKQGAYYFTAGWGIALFGFSISALATINIIPASAFTLNAFLIAMLPQAFCFAVATAQKIRREEEQEIHEIARKDRKELTLARLKESKNSADQTRLLRVLERERELMAELREREIERTEEMRQAKISADEANSAKSAFLAVVSHEIRTPMTGILGMVRLLLETSLTKDQKEYASAIQSSGDTMMALLNDILDFEKIERGGMELEEISFDLHKLVDSVVILMSGHASGRNIELKHEIAADVPRFVMGDPTRMRQVLLNLVNNAIKFTHEGHVAIILKHQKTEARAEDGSALSEIYVGVKDTGIGISEDAQAKLFSPFAQADNSTSRKYGGTGLGLAICKRIVEAMGGIIQIESQEGFGSTFYFYVRMQSGQESQTEGRAKSGGPNLTKTSIPPQKILVVEDNEMNRRVLRRFMEKDNHDIHEVDNAPDGLAKIKEHTFDIIFTDINLSAEQNGYDLAYNIRMLDNAEKSTTPLIALTGNVSNDDIQSYYDGGFNGFVAKPVDPERLKEIIENAHNGILDHTPSEPPPNPAKTQEAIPVLAQKEEPSDDEIQTDEAATPSSDIPLASDIPKATPPTADTPESDDDGGEALTPDAILDLNMLSSLLSSLGEDQFLELMKGYEDKADEIIQNIQKGIESKDIVELGNKAHELKGMAANFGISGISEIAGNIEAASKTGDEDTVLENAQKLIGANDNAKKAFQSWLTSQ